MNYQEAVDYINSCTDYEKTPVPHAAANYDLRRLEELLAYFDNPHLKTRSVHITGTKGKGSTAAMIASVLTAAGYRTGLYTSPHLLTVRERIRIGKELITEADFATTVEKLKSRVAEVNRRATYGTLTTFELLTAMAFLYFAGEKIDIQVLEVGMGGTYDATNIIKKPEVCIITSISYDHTDILGHTLSAIASEKSGIIKPGCTVVTAPQKREALEVIKAVCKERGARLIKAGEDITWRGISFDMNSQQLLVSGRRDSYDINIPLLGDHQMVNAATAVAALEILTEHGINIPKESFIRGLAEVNWPGRLQIIRYNPLIVIDGAHNPDSAEKLSHALEYYLHFKKAVLVIGTSSDKDITGIAAGLAPVAARVIATRSRHSRAASPERIIDEFARLHIPAESADSVPAAIDKAIAAAGNGGMVCVTGSLFVVAEALEIADRLTKY